MEKAYMLGSLSVSTIEHISRGPKVEGCRISTVHRDENCQHYSVHVLVTEYGSAIQDVPSMCRN